MAVSELVVSMRAIGIDFGRLSGYLSIRSKEPTVVVRSDINVEIFRARVRRQDDCPDWE
ncbi:hypothetical protein N826_08655 [Skermanella aerolata KACC 11604]|nr:hypothetical protein N826_08655 [Skermanella aerolata KACC 11604]